MSVLDPGTVEYNISLMKERPNMSGKNRKDTQYITDILSAMPEHIYWKDRDGVILGCNDEQAKSAGLSVSEIIGKTDYEMPWRDRADSIQAVDQEVMNFKETVVVEEVSRLSNGEERIFLSKKVPLYDRDHIEVIGVAGISVDITERKSIEEELNKDNQNIARERNILKEKNEFIEATLSNIVADIPGHVYWKNKEGVYLGCNDRQAKSLGFYSGKEVIGKTDFDLSWGENVAQIFRENDLLVMSTRRMHTVEEETTIDGIKRTMLSQKTPLKDSIGNIVGVLGISVDITERKDMKEELRKAKEKEMAEAAHKAQKETEHLRLVNEKQKALLEQEARFMQIANQVAHDIRSPLASLLTVVKSCTHIPEAQRITLREAAIGIGDIANHLLHEYRQKDSNEIIEHEARHPVLVSTVLIESLTIKKHQYEKLSIKFDCSFEPNTQFAFIKIQASSFKRLLSNLMNNAVDAFENKSGTIQVHLEADNEWVKISIEDSGKGMSLDVIEKILCKIPVTQGKKSGHGLGLTQVWETLDHNQGELEINSELGLGTTITLTFPRSTAPQWIAEEIVLGPNDMVVILDDDNSIHSAWDIRFETLCSENPELQVKHFQLGSEVLAFIATLTPADKERVFLLSDYELLKQELNGVEVIAKSEIKRTILVTSHYADPEVQKEAAKTGTQSLPKFLASEIMIKMNDADDTETEKVYAVIVDDNKTFVKMLQLSGFGDENTDAYHNPEHFLKNVAQYPKDMRIFLDNNYDTSNLTGLDVAKKLHELGYKRLYILSGEAYLEAPAYVTVIVKGSGVNLLDL